MRIKRLWPRMLTSIRGQSVKKVAERHFFEFLQTFPIAAPRAAKPAGYERLKAFIRSDVRAVRAGISSRGSRGCRLLGGRTRRSYSSSVAIPLLRAKKLRRMHDAPDRSAWKYAL